jgi:hypothetical protein
MCYERRRAEACVGHVLRETTSRGRCGLGCPLRTSERGGEGDCVKEGGGGEGKCERERALERLRCYSPGHWPRNQKKLQTVVF